MSELRASAEARSRRLSEADREVAVLRERLLTAETEVAARMTHLERLKGDMEQAVVLSEGEGGTGRVTGNVFWCGALLCTFCGGGGGGLHVWSVKCTHRGVYVCLTAACLLGSATAQAHTA